MGRCVAITKIPLTLHIIWTKASLQRSTFTTSATCSRFLARPWVTRARTNLTLAIVPSGKAQAKHYKASLLAATASLTASRHAMVSWPLTCACVDTVGAHVGRWTHVGVGCCARATPFVAQDKGWLTETTTANDRQVTYPWRRTNCYCSSHYPTTPYANSMRDPLGSGCSSTSDVKRWGRRPVLSGLCRYSRTM